jgi:hypothetical protein
MKLYGWEKVNSADEYREMIKTEYYRLKRERSEASQAGGLEEVKLRLFLSLLDKPRSGSKENEPQRIAGQGVADNEPGIPFDSCANG